MTFSLSKNHSLFFICIICVDIMEMEFKLSHHKLLCLQQAAVKVESREQSAACSASLSLPTQSWELLQGPHCSYQAAMYSSAVYNWWPRYNPPSPRFSNSKYSDRYLVWFIWFIIKGLGHKWLTLIPLNQHQQCIQNLFVLMKEKVFQFMGIRTEVFSTNMNFSYGDL